MDAVKSFLEIDTVYYQGCMVFKALFSYSPQGNDLFTAGSPLSESQPALLSTCCQRVLIADLTGLSRTPFPGWRAA